jgi:hypothetical protein
VKGLDKTAAKVCDVREGFTTGEDNSLLRLNKDKTLSVLSDKVLKLARALQERAEASNARSRSALGSFSTVSKAIILPVNESNTETSSSSSSSSLLPPPLNVHMESALSLLAEYITDTWVIQLSTALNISLASVAPHLVIKQVIVPKVATSPDGINSSSSSPITDEIATSSTTPAISRWNQVAANDPLSELERFTHQKKGVGLSSSDPSSSAPSTSGKLKPGMGAQSQANKKLANTAVKGLRSVASFFSAAPKDKTTTS